MLRVAALLMWVVVAASIVGCATSEQPTTNPTSTTPPGSTDMTCTEAPASLVAAIEQSLAPRGATLARIYVIRASDLDGAYKFDRVWLVGALIMGAGVRPELGIWAASSPEPRAGGELKSANASAKRYSSFPAAEGADVNRSPAAPTLESCVGPVPQA